MQYVINILLVIFDQLFCSKFPRLLVFALQFLESWFSVTNNIWPFLSQLFL